jgi:hypothetical protein
MAMVQVSLALELAEWRMSGGRFASGFAVVIGLRPQLHRKPK